MDLKNIDLRLSEEETRQLRVVQEIVDKNPSAATVAARGEGLMSDFFRKMDPEDEIEIQGNFIFDGATGKRLLRKPRTASIQDRLDGEFLILSVDSGFVRDGVKAKVKSLRSQEKLMVAIPDGTLSDDQLTQVQSGEWDKRPLQMEINITRVGDRITKATLIKAGLLTMAS